MLRILIADDQEIVRQVEVTAIDPLASMQAVDNPALKEIASEISNKLKKVIGRV